MDRPAQRPVGADEGAPQVGREPDEYPVVFHADRISGDRWDVRAQAFTTLDLDPDGFFAERCVRWANTAAQAGTISTRERDVRRNSVTPR